MTRVVRAKAGRQLWRTAATAATATRAAARRITSDVAAFNSQQTPLQPPPCHYQKRHTLASLVVCVTAEARCAAAVADGTGDGDGDRGETELTLVLTSAPQLKPDIDTDVAQPAAGVVCRPRRTEPSTRASRFATMMTMITGWVPARDSSGGGGGEDDDGPAPVQFNLW